MLDREPFRNEKSMLQRVLDRIQDIPDADLADAGELAGEMAEFYQTFNRACQRELLRRMHVAGRRFLVTDKWLCEREASSEYDYAENGRQIRDVLVSILGPAQANEYVKHIPPQTVPERWKVDTRKVLGLLNKVAPDEADAIRSTFTVIEKNPKVRFKPIVEGEGEP